MSDSGAAQSAGASSPRKAGLSPFVTACFTLNYIIGTGFLTLPWAFEQAGVLLSAVGMVVVCVIANVGSDYILSAMARAEAVTCHLRSYEACSTLEEGNGYGGCVVASGDSSPKAADDGPPKAAAAEADETTALLQGGAEDESRNEKTGAGTTNFEENIKHAFDVIDAALPVNNLKHPCKTAKSSMNIEGAESFASYGDSADREGWHRRLVVGEKKYELTELSKLFLGRHGLKAYGFAVVLDIYGFLWAYTSVFSSAMAHSFPVLGQDVDSYPLWAFAFAVIVVPMSFLELSEQASVQVFLSGCRIVMILLMLLTPLAAAIAAPTPHFDDQTEPAGAPWFAPSHVHQMVPILVFSVLFHQAVPGLADEITEKATAGAVFGYTFVLCGVAYSLIGIVVAWYFGNGVYESSNLNWESYHGGTGELVLDEDGDYQRIGVAWYFRTVSLFVVCFPAIDVISAFPLNAFVLGNSLMGLVHVDNIHEVESDRRITTAYRAVAAIPPIIGALFVRNLGLITDFSGLTGLAIAFCFPALLYVRSERKLKEMGLDPRTTYERFGSSVRSAWAMFIFGVVTIAYCFTLLVAKG